jgi:pyruvate kinase
VAASTNTQVLRQLALEWGVIPIDVRRAQTIEQMSTQILALIAARDLAEAGDVIVMTGRAELDAPGTTNHVVLHWLREG